jgi:hypothetical protein
VRVAAIVVSWNSAEHLEALLASLEAQDHPDLEVVVIDNASGDASTEVVRAARAAATTHPVRLLVAATNRGFCGGVNDALATVDPRSRRCCSSTPTWCWHRTWCAAASSASSGSPAAAASSPGSCAPCRRPAAGPSSTPPATS